MLIVVLTKIFKIYRLFHLLQEFGRQNDYYPTQTNGKINLKMTQCSCWPPNFGSHASSVSYDSLRVRKINKMTTNINHRLAFREIFDNNQ